MSVEIEPSSATAGPTSLSKIVELVPPRPAYKEPKLDRVPSDARVTISGTFTLEQVIEFVKPKLAADGIETKFDKRILRWAINLALPLKFKNASMNVFLARVITAFGLTYTVKDKVISIRYKATTKRRR